MTQESVDHAMQSPNLLLVVERRIADEEPSK